MPSVDWKNPFQVMSWDPKARWVPSQLGKSTNRDITGGSEWAEYLPAGKYDPFGYGTPGYGREPGWMTNLRSIRESIKISEASRWDLYGSSVPLTEEGKLALDKWQSKVMKGRSKNFFSKIHPSSYGEDFLSRKLGVGMQGGNFYDIMDWQEGGSEVLQKKAPKLESYEEFINSQAETVESAGKTDFYKTQKELEGSSIGEDYLNPEDDPLWEETGQRVSSGEGQFTERGDIKPALRKGSLSHGSIAQRAAHHEYFGKGLTGERTFHYAPWTTNKWLVDKPSLRGSAVYADPASILSQGKQMFGQTKTFFSEATGEMIPWNKLKLTGKSVPTGVYFGEILENVKKGLSVNDPSEFMKSFRGLSGIFQKQIRYKDSPYLENVREFTRKLRSVSRMPSRTAKQRTLKTAAQTALHREILDTIHRPILEKHLLGGPSGFYEPVNISGFEGLRSAAETSEATSRSLQGSVILGQRWRTDTGENVVVGNIEDIAQIHILGKRKKLTTLRKIWEESTAGVAESLKEEGVGQRVRLSAVRMEGTEAGKALSKVNLYWQSGRYAGELTEWGGKKIAPKIKSGFLGNVEADMFRLANTEKTLTAHVYGLNETLRTEIEGKGLSGGDISVEQPWLGIVKRTGTYEGADLIDEAGNVVQEGWEKMWKGNVDTLREAQEAMGISSLTHPPRRVTTEIPFKSAEDVIRKISSGEKFLSKRMMTIAAVTAGALLLWGATRQKPQPLMTEKDVPRSLYGSQNLTSHGGGGQGYSAQNRITPENTGYNVDMNVEAEDDRGMIDHRVMAQSLSAISSRALGHNRIKSSMHIVDDSTRSDRQSTRRQINQALNV